MPSLPSISHLLLPALATPIDSGRGLAIAVTVAALVLAVDRLRQGGSRRA